MTVVAPMLDRFYPIVPDFDWLVRLAPLGIKTVQLRIKGQPESRVADDIAKALGLSRAYGFQLIVNDYWQLALDAGADFIHLGQEDLASADLAALQKAGVRIGVSTHDEAELQAALAVQPAYIALGPVYATKLKAMPWAPQGLVRVADWKKAIGVMPLVGIGGMTPDRAPSVLAAGADSVAVITDFFTHDNPEQRVREWVAWSRSHSLPAVD